jgi:TBC1 domain family protein 5
MSGYLSPELNKEGLGKIKDALLEAGGGDLEELVKEWAWHEGLQQNTPGIVGNVNGNPSTPTPRPSAEAPKSVVRTADTLNTPRPYPSPIPSPSPSTTKPPLTLSSRTDTGPLASLPRVPQTAHLNQTNPPARPDSGVKSSTAPREADPLGKLGVNHGQIQNKASASSDPLGVGR